MKQDFDKALGVFKSFKSYEEYLNKVLASGGKIYGYHPTYYLTKVDVRGNIHNKLGTLIRRHNPELFHKMYNDFYEITEYRKKG